MFQEFFSRSTLLAWPLAGLLLSVTFFVGVLAFVFLGLRDRRHVHDLASLPFDAEETVAEPAATAAIRIGRINQS
ncbi:MAG: hypothetical protein IPK64_15760 [bacterium]|nr:hypothetical protein [bacterium]